MLHWPVCHEARLKVSRRTGGMFAMLLRCLWVESTGKPADLQAWIYSETLPIQANSLSQISNFSTVNLINHIEIHWSNSTIINSGRYGICRFQFPVQCLLDCFYSEISRLPDSDIRGDLGREEFGESSINCRRTLSNARRQEKRQENFHSLLDFASRRHRQFLWMLSLLYSIVWRCRRFHYEWVKFRRHCVRLFVVNKAG